MTLKYLQHRTMPADVRSIFVKAYREQAMALKTGSPLPPVAESATFSPDQHRAYEAGVGAACLDYMAPNKTPNEQVLFDVLAERDTAPDLPDAQDPAAVGELMVEAVKPIAPPFSFASASEAHKDIFRKAYGAAAYAIEYATPEDANPFATVDHIIGSGEAAFAEYQAWEAGAAQAHAEYRGLRNGCVGYAELAERLSSAAAAHAKLVMEGVQEVSPTIEAPVPGGVQDARPKAAPRADEAAKDPATEVMSDIDWLTVCEARLLGFIKGQRAKIQEEFGDLGKELAAYQTEGFKRDSVEAQTDKQAEFAAWEAELTTAARWLSIGKTQLEQGFMFLHRSLERPEPL